MKQVAIVTDTTACVPPELVARYGIELAPVQLTIGDKSYRDGVDIRPAEFYQRLRHTPDITISSSSAPEPYFEAFQRAGRKATSILCLTEPSRFSAMFNSAKIAAETVQKETGNLVIDVLECAETAAAGLGLVTLAAAQTAEEGRPLPEVAAKARDTMARVHLFAALDTLQYLVKSGRVPQAAAMVNSLLSIKPIFTLNGHGARTVALPMSSESAVNRLLRLMEPKVIEGKPLHAAVMHADAPDKASEIRDRIAARFACEELFITEFTPVMGVHTGPGLVGIAFYNEAT